MMIVNGLTIRENKDVIQLNDNKLVQHVPQDVIYEMLSCWGIEQAKWHDQIIEVAIPGTEDHLSPSLSLPDYKLCGGPTL